ncbi:RNA polymerase sigma factor SigZ [Lacrimispora sp. 38-1]|uniref:RNA polymerase sigma factor SigZ n=1 Tax=Lacrimispora sp. 38-1 TaxID=3125778 RepID=UPI003CE6A8F9
MASNFNIIWDEFSVPLRIFIKRRINNEQDVEDVLQNVFMKIYNNINKLEKLNNIHAWVYTVTKNTIIDYYRMQKHDSYLNELSEDIAICENLDEKTTINEISHCLIMMIQYLPEKYKQALTLTEIENVTQKQLADKAGLSVSGAKSRVQRARELLKEEFLSCCNLEIDGRGNIIDYEVKNLECNYCKR